MKDKVDTVIELNAAGEYSRAVAYIQENPEIAHRFEITFEHVVPIPAIPKKKDIDNYKLKQKEQYFRHVEIPVYWTDKYLEDMILQRGYPEGWWETQPTEEMDDFRLREWERRILGYWFMNNGTPTYITGDHYFFLNYTILDDGTRPKYRDRDRKWFLFWKYAEEDIRSYGMITPKARRVGDTSKCLSILINHTTSTEKARNGIQSKDDKSAAQAFVRAVDIEMALPQYFRMVRSGMDRPKKRLEYRPPARRITVAGKMAERKEALDSLLDYESTTETSYDGEKLHRWLQDEGGKITTGARVNHTWRVVKQCLRVGTRIVGKAMLPTTVEELDKSGGEAYRILFEQSAVATKRDNRNKQTTSGLYRLFIPAEEGLEGFIDQYGMSVVGAPTDEQIAYLSKHHPENEDLYKSGVGAREYLKIELDSIKRDGTPSDVAQFKRMYPQHVADCFRADGKECLFDIEKLNDRIDELEIMGNNQPWQRFELRWEGGVPCTKVEMIPNSSGRFKFSYIPKDDILNNVLLQYRSSEFRKFMPVNKMKFTIGLDPYDSHKQSNGRLSNAGMYGYMVLDPMAEDDQGVRDMDKDRKDWVSDNFFVEYLARPQDPRVMWNDALMLAWLLGCEVLIERNKEGAFNHFLEMGCQNFLASKPKDPTKKIKKPVNEGTEHLGAYGSVPLRMSMEWEVASYVTDTAHRCPFISLLKQFRDYEPEKITEFDAFVGSSLALVHRSSIGRNANRMDHRKKSVKSLARKYDIRGDVSRLIGK